MSKAVVIGLGGIGSNLVESLCRTLAFSTSERKAERVALIDGDAYEEQNKIRQSFSLAANKAEVSKDHLAPLFPDLEIEAKAHYIDPRNIYLFIREGDAVFMCVDNHATRKLVSDYVGTLRNALLISGGNEEFDGNVQIYERRDGNDVTPPLTHAHPEIAHPKDKNPADKHCTERVSEGAAQLLAVNFDIAAKMLGAYTVYLLKGQIPYHEVCFNLLTGNSRAIKRVWNE